MTVDVRYMRLFSGLKKDKITQIFAPVAGEVVEMKNIADTAFSEGILGFACGIEPSDGRIFAPCDGNIIQTSDTSHAIGIKAENGVELLIHVGIDTVDMHGNGFRLAVTSGEAVKKGQLLITAELEKIREAGHPTTVVTVVTNFEEYANVKLTALGRIEVGSPLIEVTQ